MTLTIDLSTFPALCQRLPPGIASDYCINIHPKGRIGFRIPHPADGRLRGASSTGNHRLPPTLHFLRFFLRFNKKALIDFILLPWDASPHLIGDPSHERHYFAHRKRREDEE